MVIISRVGLLIHDELKALLDWYLTDLVRHIGGHSLTSLTLLFIEDVIVLPLRTTRIQGQETDALSLDADKRFVKL